ncbi:MAG: discoidin domain-containing protein [Candidatus Hinthialibacter antarcticus]|nr:discoidin domain-containing protein [Candidatus Hinthialibacter antarcticus]
MDFFPRTLSILLLACIKFSLCVFASASSPYHPTISSSSVHSDEYQVHKAIDGDESTRWASAPRGNANLTIDFGQSVSFEQMTIFWEAAFSSSYEIQVSDDGQSWTTIFRQTDGKGGVEEIEALNGVGQFVRFNCLASKQYPLISIWEIDFHNPKIEAILQSICDRATQPDGPPLSRKDAIEDLLDHGVKEIVFSTRADGNDGHWYANIGYWAYDENDMLYGKGGRLCKLNIETGKMDVLMDDPEGTVRDPVVHYDGEKVLFSWRKSGSKIFHLYECNLDGGDITQLTDGEYDDFEPCYLPDGGIVFVSCRGKRWVNCWLTQVAILYRCDGDGGNVQQLSANIEHDNTPWVLPDGRILYQRWEYIDRSQVDFHHLWTMNPDGTNQMVYFGNMHPSSLYIDAKPIPNTRDVMLINSPGHGSREHSGHVAIVNSQFGPDHKDSLTNISDKPEYRDPWPLSRELYLVARGRSIQVMNEHGNASTIYTVPKSFGAKVNIQEPRPVIEREREKLIASRTDASQPTGKLILQDVTIGRSMKGVRQGEIQKLLVIESLPKPINFTGGMDPLTYGGSFTLERVMGTVPVEADGSAYLQLPAKRSFFFIALDENNNSVKRMQSFLTVMPGETQSCTGCHENRNSIPDYTGRQATLMALQRPASPIQPIEGLPDVYDFPRDIQPILNKHCVSCHNQIDRKGGVVLTGDRGPMFSHSYVSLTLKRQVADGRNIPKGNYSPRTLGASASPLMKKLNGGHHDVKASEHERDVVRYWIETGGCYPGTYAALGHGAIGGYQQNEQINMDADWPTGEAFQRVVQNQCFECHENQLGLPTPLSISDEIGISFWRFDIDDEKFKFSRHLMFNLTKPERSLFLLAPLDKQAGGLGLCSETVFESQDDNDYQVLLNHISAGKDFLENDLTRFDMAHFKPRKEYFREMIKYGVLPASFDPASDPYDVYQIDRAYWQSLWHQPVN